MSGPEPTRRVRIKLDFVVGFDRDLTALPIDETVINKMVMAATKALGRDSGVVSLFNGVGYEITLDRRKLRQPKAARAPKKARRS